jgi:hypothetical protein
VGGSRRSWRPPLTLVGRTQRHCLMATSAEEWPPGARFGGVPDLSPIERQPARSVTPARAREKARVRPMLRIGYASRLVAITWNIVVPLPLRGAIPHAPPDGQRQTPAGRRFAA